MVIRNKMAQNVGPPKRLQMKSFPAVSRNDVVETLCVFFYLSFQFQIRPFTDSSRSSATK